MSRGKYLSLEEARRLGQIDQFCKGHPSEAGGRSWLDVVGVGSNRIGMHQGNGSVSPFHLCLLPRASRSACLTLPGLRRFIHLKPAAKYPKDTASRAGDELPIPAIP